jgi:hypothetical protein
VTLISLRLERADVDQLEQRARAAGVDRSEYLRRLIRRHLER